MTEHDIQELAFEALDWHTKPDLCADIRAGRGSPDMRERFASACAGVKVGLAHAEARLEALERLPARIRSQTNAVKSYMTIGGIGGYAGAAENSTASPARSSGRWTLTQTPLRQHENDAAPG